MPVVPDENSIPSNIVNDLVTGLRSLSFAVCLICHQSTTQSRIGKRIMRTGSPGSRGGFAPKRRMANSGAVIEVL